jgi:hypothetical protein
MNEKELSRMINPAQEFKVLGKLRPVKYRKQNVPQCHKEFKLGEAIKDGMKVWTTNALYYYNPTMHHTGKITFGLYNGSGRAFVQLAPHEFDEWLSALYQWRQENHEEIAKLIDANLQLTNRQEALKHVETILNDPNSNIDELLPNWQPQADKDMDLLVEYLVRIIDRLVKSKDKFSSDIYYKLIRDKLKKLSESPKHLEFIKTYMEDSLSYKRDIFNAGGYDKIFGLTTEQPNNPTGDDNYYPPAEYMKNTPNELWDKEYTGEDYGDYSHLEEPEQEY